MNCHWHQTHGCFSTISLESQKDSQVMSLMRTSKNSIVTMGMGKLPTSWIIRLLATCQFKCYKKYCVPSIAFYSAF